MYSPSPTLFRSILLMIGFWSAATSRADDPQMLADTIEFQLVPEQETFDTQQGVWLTAIATNRSDEPVTFVWGDYPYDDLFVFELSHPDGSKTPSPRSRRCPSIDAIKSQDVITLGPGESRERLIVLTMQPAANAQAFRFVLPGIYLLKSRFRVIPVRTADNSFAAYEGAGDEIEVEADERELTLRGPVPDPSLHFSMKGIVANVAGEPVSGVEVYVESQRSSIGGPSLDGVYWQRIDRVVTDRRGRFSVEGLDRSVPAHRLLLSHPDHPLELIEVPTIINEGIVELEPFTLRDGYPLPGIVTDPDGQPIVGARITTTIDRVFWTNLDGQFEATGFHTAIDELENVPYIQVWKRGWIEAGEPEFVEIDGHREIKQVLMPESAQQVTGIARFENGEPAAGRELHVFRVPSDGYPIETTTDVQGRFMLDWPQSTERANRGHVAILDPGESHLPRRAWIAEFDDIAPGESNVEFVFARNEQLQVEVKPTNTLPESVTMSINVRLKLVGHREQSLFEEKLPSTGGSLSWDHLSPGEYSIEVTIDRAEHWNWRQTIDLPAENGTSGMCRFELPKLEFGSATLNVVTSDGVTPWLGGSIWIDSSHGWGSIPVRNGRAELRDVPSGPIHVEVHTEGYACTHLRGEVVAGESVDLGTLQALTIEEGTGLVVGRVLLPGGGPAIGARVQGQGGSYARPLHMGGEAVDGDGLFELRLDPGEQTIEINDVHVAALGEGETSNPEFSFGISQRRLASRVNVVAGEETQVEITLPLPMEGIQISGDAIGTALIYMQIDEKTTFEDVVVAHSSLEPLKLEWIPEGLAQVVLSRPFTEEVWSDESTTLFAWEHHWVDVNAEQVTLQLGEVEAGRVRVTLTTTAGETIENFVMRAAPTYGILPAAVQSRLTPDQVHSTGVYVEDGNGVLYLTPGKYTLTVGEGERTQSHEIEIRDGETIDLTLLRINE